MTGSGARWGLVAAGWSAYAFYYLGRVNFSAAVPGLESEMGFTPSQIGFLAAGFFWVYSLSVAPVGRLADRIGTRWLVGLGLTGSGLANIWFAYAGSFAPALAAWSANGVFQAMGWTPLLGALRRWVPPERASRVIASFGSCFVAGTALALALGGVIAERAGAQRVFLAAAAVLIPLGLAWWAAVRDPVGKPSPVRPGAGAGMRRAAPLLVPAAAVGAAFVALVVWTPAYFAQAHGLSESRAGALSAVLPALAVAVTFAAGRWFRRAEGPRSAAGGAVLLAAAALALAAASGASGLAAGFAAMAAATALVGAASSVTLGLFPRLLDDAQAAFTGGIFVLAFNLGGGAASPVMGRLVERGSWNLAFLFLAACAAAGALWTGGWYAKAKKKGG